MGKRKNKPPPAADLNVEPIGADLPPLKFKQYKRRKPKKKQKARGPHGDR